MRASILPFAILLSALLAACGGSTEEEGSGGGGGGAGGGGAAAGEDECEGSPPSDDCPADYVCLGGSWICDCLTNCETPGDCPADRPSLVNPTCSVEGLPRVCSYDISDVCPGAEVHFSCYSGETPVFTDCDCRSFESSASCPVGPCRWLEPGCDDNPAPLGSAGCYPVEDCVEGQCPRLEEVCTPVSVLPGCEGDGCEACSIVENLCVQVVGG